MIDMAEVAQGEIVAPRDYRALWLWTLGIFLFLALLDTLRVLLWTYGADTGTFVQIVLDAFGGMRNGIEHGTHYRYHWSPSLVFLWPVLAATHEALALQLVQVAAMVAVAPLMYALVLPRAGAALALRAAMITLLYPPLVAIGWGEFHDIGLWPLFALGLLVAADRGKWWWFAACVVLSIGLREDVCVELIVIGVALGIAGWRSRTAWFVTAAAALVSLVVYYSIVIPRVGGAWLPAHFYTYPFATGPLTLVLAPFVHPGDFVRTFFTFGRLTYLLEAFAPLAFLPFFSRWWLLALPGLAIVLLANDQLVYHMGNHYAALWAPWLLAATAFAIARMRSIRWANCAIGVCLVVLAFFNPLHPAHFLKPNYHDLSAARGALACVPANASVATHDEWFSTIAAHNPNATLATIHDVDYLVYADDFPNAGFIATVIPALHAEVAAGDYHQICRFGTVATYARKGLHE